MGDFPEVTIGLAQMPVKGGEPEANLAIAEAYIGKAAAAGCDVVVLPECLDTGWTHPSGKESAQSIPGPVSDRLCKAAQVNSLYVAAGIVERDGDKIYNASILISDAGEIILKHRKINELPIAFDLYDLGTSLDTVQTPFGRVAIPICADNQPHSSVIGHTLGRMGVQIILSPSSWAVPADYNNEKTPYGGLWNETYGELSRIYGMTVIGVSNVGMVTAGPWKDRPCIGASRAFGPDGKMIVECKYGEDAEDFRTITVPVIEPAKKGTDLSEGLKLKVKES